MNKQRILKLKHFSEKIDEAEITNLFVSVGENVSINASLMTLETNKTAIDLGSPLTGKVSEIFVKVGEKIYEDSDLICLDIVDISTDKSNASLISDIDADLVVIGGGPAGYTAAFRAADLGVNTILIDKYPELGGTCLNCGCIPSKFLLHIVSSIRNAKHLSNYGVKFDEPFIDLSKLMQAKDNVVRTLNSGLRNLSHKRNIRIVRGTASFEDKNRLKVASYNDVHHITFNKAIIATGSTPRKINSVEIEDPRIFYSEQALNIKCIPNRLLVVGGGVIGLELSSVFHGLGADVTVIEATSKFLNMLDEDIVAPLLKQCQDSFNSMMTETILDDVQVTPSTLSVRLRQNESIYNRNFDAILIATGRAPITQDLNLSKVGISTNENGFIEVDNNFCTSTKNIYAIGDVIGNPMLAHKGSKEGRIVAEICANQIKSTNINTMPFVVYTDPEIAWIGVTEKEGSNNVDVVRVPWVANGRALTQDSSYGMTKLLIEKTTGVIVGGGLVGPNVGEMISELTLAVENELTVNDLSSMIHPHPTVSETISMCAEKYLSEAIEILNE